MVPAAVNPRTVQCHLPYADDSHVGVRQESAAGRWRRYDSRVEAALGMGAAGVVESLLRLTARMPISPEYAIMTSQVQRSPQGGPG